MRSILLAIFTAGLTIILGVAVVLMPRTNSALTIAESISQLLNEEGLHVVYVNGIVVFRDNRIIVEAGDTAEIEVHNKTLVPSAGSGLIRILVNNTHAVILRF